MHTEKLRTTFYKQAAMDWTCSIHGSNKKYIYFGSNPHEQRQFGRMTKHYITISSSTFVGLTACKFCMEMLTMKVTLTAPKWRKFKFLWWV
jgi:hypothetical protein